MANQPSIETITAWAKRRGFVYPSSDLYGGLANSYDYGPYGVALKDNLRNLWWKNFIQDREDIFGIDSSIILKSDIWEASGHTQNFADVMIEDKKTHKRYRADHIIEDFLETKKGQKNLSEFLKNKDSLIQSEVPIEIDDLEEALTKVKVDGLKPEVLAYILTALNISSPDGNEITEPKRFNQLFQTEIGIIAGEKNKAYLRGEIAQGLFMNFKNIIDSMHPKLPFGIGQAGKAFRNEITAGKFTHRTLEFDLMEFEYFFNPNDKKWEDLYDYWKEEIYKFAVSLGFQKENLRWREHEDFERAHYSLKTEDLEYNFPWGFKEMFAVAYRTDFDLRNHQEKSGRDLQFIYPDGKKVLPHVIEPTFGLSRLLTVLFFDCYKEEEVNGNKRVVMKFHPKIAPVQAAVFPLQKDEKLKDLAKDIYSKLKNKFRVEFDNAGNIGKMYRRQDEIGTPICVTVDFDSLEDKKVTVRDRDTMKQERVEIGELNEYIAKKVS